MDYDGFDSGNTEDWSSEEWENYLDGDIGIVDEDYDDNDNLLDVNNVVDNVLNNNVSGEIDTFILEDNGITVGAIEYIKTSSGIHIEFLGTINGKKEDIVSSDYFLEKFNGYFGDGDFEIDGVGTDLLEKFIRSFKKGTTITFESLESSESFYIKSIKKLEIEGRIEVLEQCGDYVIVVL